ncbi:MAG: 3-oxoacid CoA-transferase [Anaerolineales bacterium]
MSIPTRELPRITTEEAANLVPDDATLMVGGFGMTGHPVHLVHALAKTSTKNLTYIGNNAGEPNLGGGRLLNRGQITKAIASFFTSNPDAVKAAQSGSIEVELLPQGSLVEAIRAGGAGIGGFYTGTAVGTVLGQDRETKVIDGRTYVFVPALRADVSFIHAWKADAAGNLMYRMTERNFNKAMATAANIVIAEAEEIVPVGSLDPEHVHTPGIYVDYLVEVSRSLQDLGSSGSVDSNVSDQRMRIAERALQELKPGDVVNLGIGIPTFISNLITPEFGVTLHSESGMLGVGPSPQEGGALDYPVNAGKIPVTELPGSSYFDSSDSFAMIRGGHVDVAVMGGLQVDQSANLANWAVPGMPLLGVGGAMDLAQGARRLIVTMTHRHKDGSPKIVPECTLPLTALAAVNTVITELAVFEFVDGELTLIDIMPGSSLEEVGAHTGARFRTDLHHR